MGSLGFSLIVLAAFLTVSWFFRIIISQDVSRRVDRKVAEDKAGLCTWPREMTEE
jgi:hypothetical protein